MSTYEIIMICIAAMNLVLSLVKAVKGKKRKQHMRKATAYCQCAVAL